MLPVLSWLRGTQAANITEEDIDAIIQKGQRATEELNEKMKQYTENAMQFTMDGGIAYEYKDEEDVPEEAPNYKAIAGVLRPPCLTLPRAKLGAVFRESSCFRDLHKVAASVRAWRLQGSQPVPVSLLIAGVLWQAPTGWTLPSASASAWSTMRRTSTSGRP